ncbi:hypothetical protein GTA51_19825 [Desulfovibrio aerotolerans]|uniref:Uncharacterized protein n=1 Tax=Solidesulfovibrio aerotolerans TaxID=295255 RepID=A0A7C9IPJ3_9BACT|nr:hypothetical protein [Solidesulfovibrio aerotolerans]MYL85346.1 hypothetical protein [Solidesulfovibrio aerotolerans]
MQRRATAPRALLLGLPARLTTLRHRRGLLPLRADSPSTGHSRMEDFSAPLGIPRKQRTIYGTGAA